MYCTKCGNKNVEGAKYCTNCGITIGNKNSVNNEKSVENEKPIDNNIENIGSEETVVGFKATEVNTKEIKINSLKPKAGTSSKKPVIIITLVLSITVGASFVGVMLYKNMHKQKVVTVSKQVIDETGIIFPDNNLEKIIRAHINKPTGDIVKSDVNTITSLTADGNDITNLSGIENLTNLTELSLINNKISNIEPLKSLIKLTTLYITDNQITNIETLKGLTNITNLSLKNNKINDYTPVKSYYTKLKTKDFTLEDKVDIDYILHNSSTEELKESDLGNLTKQQLTLARNEVFARHGFVFNTEYIKNYFESKSWYQTDPSYKGELSSMEKFNVEVIKKVEDGKK